MIIQVYENYTTDVKKCDMSISITYVETDISFWRAALTVILRMWSNPSYFPFKIVGFLEIKESGLRGSYFEMVLHSWGDIEECLE